MKEEKIIVEGKIIKGYPAGEFDVQIDESFGGHVIRAYVSGKMRSHYISLIEGDLVTVELTPYDIHRGRIIFRKK